MRNGILPAAFVATLLAASSTYADGLAPNYGNCAPTGRKGSISLTTVEPDVLIVATVLPNPGWYNGVTPQGVSDGYEYCMAAEIAHRAGIKKLKLMNLAWDQYISGTARGYDIAIASTTITDPRRKMFDFSQPYFTSNLGVVIKTGADVTAENIRGKRIGVLQGNVGSDWVVNTLRPDVQPSLFQAQPDMITALIASQIDAVVSDTTLVLSATAGTSGRLQVVGQYQLDQGYGVITSKGSQNTVAINEAVGAMVKDGTFSALSKKYLTPLFGIDPNAVPLWQLP